MAHDRYSPQGNLDKAEHSVRMLRHKGFTVAQAEQLERIYLALETVVMTERAFQKRRKKNEEATNDQS